VDGGKIRSKNAFPSCGRKRIFADFGATPFLKHFQAGLLYVFEKTVTMI
jgi:hypothetical protein